VNPHIVTCYQAWQYFKGESHVKGDSCITVVQKNKQQYKCMCRSGWEPRDWTNSTKYKEWWRITWIIYTPTFIKLSFTHFSNAKFTLVMLIFVAVAKQIFTWSVIIISYHLKSLGHFKRSYHSKYKHAVVV